MLDRTDLVARSPAMKRVMELARRAAPSEATVLITGESGTGKERLARFIHQHSRRRERPLVAINCGALPESLLESELFGHRKGAFTGADTDREGLFETAKGGTLFLDEIGETTPRVQVGLLRTLQERTVRPVGGRKDLAVDIRLVAATNRDLDRLVEEGPFRRDLYYRLRVIPLEVPPLRSRPEDLLPLVREFIGRTCTENQCGPCALSPAALDLLQAYNWPGNVRELENAIERAVVLAEHKPIIGPGDLPPEIRGHGSPESPGVGALRTLRDVERQHILATLEQFDGNRKDTAQALGIGVNTLWRKLKGYGLVKERRPREERGRLQHVRRMAGPR